MSEQYEQNFDYKTDARLTKEAHDENRAYFMTDDEMTEINYFISMLYQNQGWMSQKYVDWSKEDKAYRGDQDKKDKRPNTRINIMNAIIESQVANLIDKNIAAVCRGQSPTDQSFANWCSIGLNWTFKKNFIKKILAVHERRRSLHGCAFLKLWFDPDAIDGFGLVKISTPPLNKIYHRSQQ